MKKDPMDLDGMTLPGLQEKAIFDLAKGIKKQFGIAESQAVAAAGYVLQLKNDYVNPKDVPVIVGDLIKKSISELSEIETGLLLSIGALKHRKPPFISSTKNIGRNEPCPCESGKKFKNCCIALAKAHEMAEYNGKE